MILLESTVFNSGNVYAIVHSFQLVLLLNIITYLQKVSDMKDNVVIKYMALRTHLEHNLKVKTAFIFFFINLLSS